MASFNLLLMLPDSKNERVLACKGGNGLPSYTELVGENVAFDEPQMYNNYFREITGIPVYRRYTFNTPNYVVFVFEQANRDNVIPRNGFDWVSYDDFMAANCDEVNKIAKSVSLHYNLSKNMPWVNAKGFTPYFAWLNSVCEKNGIRINGEIVQLKNAYVSTVLCAPTDMGNVYMKIPGKLYIAELSFTSELRKLGIADLPGWIDFDLNMNVVLMKDMGGNDLPNQSDIDTLKVVILQYAQIQKDSILHLPLNFEHYDNTIAAILDKLDTFPQKSFEMLKGTQYEISKDELAKLSDHITTAAALLKSINHIPVPDTIHHGDVRPGNIRVVDGNYIFYDWSWGAISHPFIEIVSFLHIIRRTLPNESAKEMLIDSYLQEWLSYGTLNDLKYAFSTLSVLKDLFFALVDYDWVEAIKRSSNESIDFMSADGWLLERRNYYFANVLRRFIKAPLAVK